MICNAIDIRQSSAAPACFNERLSRECPAQVPVASKCLIPAAPNELVCRRPLRNRAGRLVGIR
jgi:hypothetical protein